MASTPILLPCASPTEPTPKVSHDSPHSVTSYSLRALYHLPEDICAALAVWKGTVTCADPSVLLLWCNVAGDTWFLSGRVNKAQCLDGAAAKSAAVLTRPLSLCSAGLVLVTDAIAGMGLAPGRHTLGQQVVEIDGLNTYIAGKCSSSC